MQINDSVLQGCYDECYSSLMSNLKSQSDKEQLSSFINESRGRCAEMLKESQPDKNTNNLNDLFQRLQSSLVFGSIIYSLCDFRLKQEKAKQQMLTQSHSKLRYKNIKLKKEAQCFVNMCKSKDEFILQLKSKVIVLQEQIKLDQQQYHNHAKICQGININKEVIGNAGQNNCQNQMDIQEYKLDENPFGFSDLSLPPTPFLPNCSAQAIQHPQTQILLSLEKDCCRNYERTEDLLKCFSFGKPIKRQNLQEEEIESTIMQSEELEKGLMVEAKELDLGQKVQITGINNDSCFPNKCKVITEPVPQEISPLQEELECKHLQAQQLEVLQLNQVDAETLKQHRKVVSLFDIHEQPRQQEQKNQSKTDNLFTNPEFNILSAAFSSSVVSQQQTFTEFYNAIPKNQLNNNSCRNLSDSINSSTQVLLQTTPSSPSRFQLKKISNSQNNSNNNSSILQTLTKTTNTTIIPSASDTQITTRQPMLLLPAKLITQTRQQSNCSSSSTQNLTRVSKTPLRKILGDPMIITNKRNIEQNSNSKYNNDSVCNANHGNASSNQNTMQSMNDSMVQKRFIIHKMMTSPNKTSFTLKVAQKDLTPS